MSVTLIYPRQAVAVEALVPGASVRLAGMPGPQGNQISSTDDLAEGADNLYHTAERVEAIVGPAVAAEAATRGAADTALAASIAAETSARTTAVSAEATARASADTTLQAAIDAEAGARAAADGVLQTAIDGKSSSWVQGIVSGLIGSVVQGYSATLAALSALATEAWGRSLLTLASASAGRTALELHAVAASGSYNDLNNKPTIPAASQWASGAGGVISYSGGNVGIGTSAPSYTLDILGSPSAALRVKQSATSSNPYFVDFQNSAGSSMLSVSAQRVRVGNSLSTPNIYNTTSERGLIAINNSATGSSAGLINISGEVGTSAILVAQNTDSDYVSVFEARDEVDAVLFNIKSDGNVGIGATDPVTRLDVNGAIRTRPVTVATLPSAALGDGMRHCVTNASVSHTAGIGTIVAGGGANKVPVISFGGQWYIG